MNKYAKNHLIISIFKIDKMVPPRRQVKHSFVAQAICKTTIFQIDPGASGDPRVQLLGELGANDGYVDTESDMFITSGN